VCCTVQCALSLSLFQSRSITNRCVFVYGMGRVCEWVTIPFRMQFVSLISSSLISVSVSVSVVDIVIVIVLSCPISSVTRRRHGNEFRFRPLSLAQSVSSRDLICEKMMRLFNWKWFENASRIQLDCECNWRKFN